LQHVIHADAKQRIIDRHWVDLGEAEPCQIWLPDAPA
jgi:hypothetical protein